MEGKVVRDQNDKTITVRVKTIKEHAKYRKRIRLYKNYQVHDENNQYKLGDVVKFSSCRPVSKLKKWAAYSEGEKK